jgi:hypothetical protein
MIETEIVCFYPQGVIVQYNEEFFGFVDYNDCKSVLGASNMYPQQKIKLLLKILMMTTYGLIFQLNLFKHFSNISRQPI